MFKSIPNRRDSLARSEVSERTLNKMKMDEVARVMLKESHVVNAKFTFLQKVKRNDDMEEYT